MTAVENMRVNVRPRNDKVHNAAILAGYSPLQASIIAGRLEEHCAADIQRYVRPTLRDLDPPDLLPDIDVAGKRIAKAVILNEPILICVDHDADGISSAAVVYGALVDAFGVDPTLVHPYSSHRLNEGYGISDGLVDRMLADGHRSGLLISADQGSGDELRIARLKSAGIDSVVTDHHGIEGKGPESAVACVNPCRSDSVFPDRFIAGCHVAWLVMAHVRRLLVSCGHLPDEAPKLGFLLGAVALGTTADCVSFARSRNNRLIVQRGLHLMNTAPDPCWTALSEAKGLCGPITSETLGWIFGPAVNSGGRLDDAIPGFKLMRSVTVAEATRYAELLFSANEKRKSIEQGMREQATLAAESQVGFGRKGLCIWMDDGHSGIHGITAGRIAQQYGRPTLCLSPKRGEPGVATGSARTIPGFNVRQAFLTIAERAPGMLIKHGGHEGAGGLTLLTTDIARIESLWDAAVSEQGVHVGPVLETDGALPAPPSLALLTEINALAPYGREFDSPVFSQRVRLLTARRVGDEGKHLSVQLDVGGVPTKGIWFSFPEQFAAVQPGSLVDAVFTLESNTYRGNTTVQLMLKHMIEA